MFSKIICTLYESHEHPVAIVFDSPLELAQPIFMDTFLTFSYGFLQEKINLLPGRLLTIKQLLPVMHLQMQIAMKYRLSRRVSRHHSPPPPRR